MTRSLVLLVLLKVLLMGAAASHWRDWWTEDGWRAWQQVWRRNGLIKDVSDYIVPTSFLEIKFGKKVYYPGDRVSPLEAASAPDVAWYCDNTRFYTLLLLNVDGAGTNARNQVVKWRVDGIRDCDLSTGRTSVRYTTPTPVPGAGNRRYLFVLFETDSYSHNLVGDLLKSTAARIDFSTDEYIKNNGVPFAGNFVYLTNLLGDVKLLPGATSLPLSGVTAPLNKLESSFM